jgi:hypothetical protein
MAVVTPVALAVVVLVVWWVWPVVWAEGARTVAGVVGGRGVSVRLRFVRVV